MQALTDEEIPAKLAEYRDQVQNGGRSLDDVLPEVFALGARSLFARDGMRHYDVQLVGGMVLHAGKIAEMKTGRRQNPCGHASRGAQRAFRARASTWSP